MGANLYGVANPWANAVFGLVPTLVNCPAGVETTFIGQQMIAPSQGLFYPVVFGYIQIVCGATPPTSVSIFAKVGAGSDFNGSGIPTQHLTANNTFDWWYLLTGLPSRSVWQGAGNVINVTCNPIGQAVTVTAAGGYCQFFLFRAADQ